MNSVIKGDRQMRVIKNSANDWDTGEEKDGDPENKEKKVGRRRLSHLKPAKYWDQGN